MDILIKYKLCVLKRKIKTLMDEISHERLVLIHRSDRYHNGRLNIENLMEDYSSQKMAKIFQIKRELVKLKQNESRNKQ